MASESVVKQQTEARRPDDLASMNEYQRQITINTADMARYKSEKPILHWPCREEADTQTIRVAGRQLEPQ